MKNFLPLIFSLVLFVGCERIEGQLNVTNDVKLVSSRNVNRTIRVGTYSADIKASSKNKITLRLNNDGDEKYVFNLPTSSLPENGSFSYKSAQVGQPVDLTGTVKTLITQSERQQSTEACQYQEPVQVCRPMGPNGQMYCTIEYQNRFGTRWIEYYNRKTDKDVFLSIAAANTGVESAQFQGNASWVERIILSQTPCRYY